MTIAKSLNETVAVGQVPGQVAAKVEPGTMKKIGTEIEIEIGIGIAIGTEIEIGETVIEGISVRDLPQLKKIAHAVTMGETQDEVVDVMMIAIET